MERMAVDPPLETERLILREHEEGDFAAVHEYARDEEVVWFMEWGPNSEEETRNFLERVLGQRRGERCEFTLAVVVKGGGLIGNCSLRVDWGNEEGELGYVYGRDYWGNGYGSEAARALVDFGFERLNLHRIYAKCVVENAGSAGVMEKVGMRREGCFREHRMVHGAWRDYFYYAMLEREWREQR